MAKIYPYIDIAVLDDIRGKIVAGDALCVLTPVLNEVLWANAAGARLLGYSNRDEVIGFDPEIGAATKRQILAAGAGRTVGVRLAGGVSTRLAMISAETIQLPDGSGALLLSESVGAGKPGDMLEGLDGDGSHVAILGASGDVLAKSPGFDALGIESDALTDLADELRGEADRMVKRRIRTRHGYFPAGIGLLSDAPSVSLLLVIDVEDVAVNAPVFQPDEKAAFVPSVSSPIEVTTPAPISARQERQTAHRYFADEDETEPESRSLEIASDAPPLEELPVEPVVELSAPVETVRTEEEVREELIAIEDIEDEGSALVDESEELTLEQLPVDLTPVEPVFVPEPETEAGEEFFHETAALPVRFVWRIDGSGKFSEVSPEFARAVGHHSADIIGRTFRDVAQVYALDMGGEISDLLERRDTWSGRSVLWPIEGTDLRAPVDLAALPIYGRDREFDGFKGFGIVRLADAVVDADGIGLSLVGPLTKIDARETVEPKGEPDVDDPWKGEKPVLSFVSPVERPRIDDAKIIRLEERRGPRGDAAIEAPLATNVLSASERSAFREIAERLRDDDARKVTFGKRMIRPGDKRDAPETIIVDPDVVDTDSDEIESEPMDEFSAAAYLPEDDAEIAAPGDQPLAEPTEQSKYEAMLRDLIKTVEKPIDEDLLPTLVTDATPAIQYDEMLRDILVTVDEPAIDQKLIRVMPTEEILRLAEEHHRQELEERERNGVAEIDAETDVLQSDEHLDLDPVAERDEEIAPDDDVVSPVHWPDVAFDEEEELAELPLPQAEPAPSQSGPDTSILTRLPAPIMIYSGRQVHFANPAFLELTGYRSASELETLGGIDQLIAGDHADEESDRISIRIGGNGIRPFNTIIRSVPWDGKQAMMLTIREQDLHPNHNVRALPISDDERRDLLELRQEAAELSSILDTATDGVVILDAKGNIRSLSNSAEALFGFDPTEIVGKPFSLLLATESQRSVSDYISGMSGTGVASIMNDGREVIGREAHGRFIPLFMTIGRLQDSDGYCAVLRDMTQWKRAEEELIEARRAAEEASATKTEFLTRVSHEIRTPLNAIIGFSELMAEERFGPIGNQRYLDYSKDINRSGRHVLDLVNDLLDISKIEAGEQEMNFEAVALNETLAETVALMQPQANRERVIIRSSFASTLPEIVADLRSIKQIALNLLSNAIRYTGAGGQVIISTAHELTGDVVIRVRDTGVGMSAQDIDQAMKPFKQLNTIKRGRGDGTGLGLPLTKAMVEGNRAKFSLTSTPGKGTLVEITFPSVRVLAN